MHAEYSVFRNFLIKIFGNKFCHVADSFQLLPTETKRQRREVNWKKKKKEESKNNDNIYSTPESLNTICIFSGECVRVCVRVSVFDTQHNMPEFRWQTP